MPGNQRRVIFVMRPPGKDKFSIEGLFETIESELRKKIQIETYVVGPRTSLIKDLICLYAKKADVYHITGDVQYLTPFLPKNKNS